MSRLNVELILDAGDGSARIKDLWLSVGRLNEVYSTADDEARDRIDDELYGVASKMARIAPSTIDGVITKLNAAKWYASEGPNAQSPSPSEQLMDAAIVDLERITAGS